jgi:hypothetical protein
VLVVDFTRLIRFDRSPALSTHSTEQHREQQEPGDKTRRHVRHEHQPIRLLLPLLLLVLHPLVRMLVPLQGHLRAVSCTSLLKTSTAVQAYFRLQVVYALLLHLFVILLHQHPSRYLIWCVAERQLRPSDAMPTVMRFRLLCCCCVNRAVLQIG